MLQGRYKVRILTIRYRTQSSLFRISTSPAEQLEACRWPGQNGKKIPPTPDGNRSTCWIGLCRYPLPPSTLPFGQRRVSWASIAPVIAASSRSSSEPSVHPSRASACWTRSACVASAWVDVGVATSRPGGRMPVAIGKCVAQLLELPNGCDTLLVDIAHWPLRG